MTIDDVKGAAGGWLRVANFGGRLLRRVAAAAADPGWAQGAEVPVPEGANNELARALAIRLISMGIGLTSTLLITYYGVKVLAAALDPTSKEKKEERLRAQELMRALKIPEHHKLSEYELCIAANLVDPNSITTCWDDIGGLASVIREIKESVIFPFKRPDLFSGSQLYQAPKGVLLYGPPGCGKTMLARAAAKESGAIFINLQMSSLFDKWYGESQKRTEAVFTLARKLQPAIIFIDEIDTFLRSRNSSDHESTAIMKTQFMTLWDGLSSQHNTRIMIIGATNRPGDVDAAILRRMPTQILVGTPEASQRETILRVILRNEAVAPDVLGRLSEVAGRAENFSGSDLRELCRNAAMSRLRDNLQDGRIEALTTDQLRLTFRDFEAALQRMSVPPTDARTPLD